MVVAAVACKKKEAVPESAPAKPAPTAAVTETKPAEPAPPAPTTPPAAKPADAPKEPHAPAAFLKDVPAKPTTAKVGQLAWAIHGNAFDTPDASRVEVDEVLAVDGNTATVRELSLMSSGPDSWKHKPNPGERPYAGLPGLLVFPAHTVDEVKPKVGDNVFVFFGNTPTPELAHVKAVEGGLVTVDIPNAMGDKTEEKKTDLIEPYGKGVAPFTFVTYKEGDEQKLATVLALDGDKVFAFDPGGKLITLKKASVKPLKPEWKSRKVGDKVYAFTFGSGKAGAITAVSVPDQVYKVDVYTALWNTTFDKLP
jgi:hypothetical protein